MGLAVFLPFFALGGMGGGDVKLMAAVGAWLGWPAILPPRWPWRSRAACWRWAWRGARLPANGAGQHLGLLRFWTSWVSGLSRHSR